MSRMAEAGKNKKTMAAAGNADAGSHIVMGKYILYDGDENITGEGTSSICRRGQSIETKAPVAIKVYKGKPGKQNVLMKKFRRQIEVLQKLMEPLEKPADSRLWCDQLASLDASSIFMQLIDYSKDASGEPGPDPVDGEMYVVTELAAFSLKYFIKCRKEKNRPLSPESVWDITKAILLVMAGLHAKGLVHLDLKPENLMLFEGKLKLIDVDGCVPIGATACIDDSSLSFSPCYCAPEWAAFLIEDTERPQIIVSPPLDVWGVGMTICEAISLEAHLKKTYASFMRHGRSHREAGFHFMDWLSHLKKVDLPEGLDKHDPLLATFLTNYVFVHDKNKRPSMAECLQHPYITNKERPEKEANKDKGKADDSDKSGLYEEQAEGAKVIQRHRLEDRAVAIVFKDKVWKLHTAGDLKERKDWFVRDMWITNNSSLCYFSPTANKRLLLLDSCQLHDATIKTTSGCAKENVFTVEFKAEQDSDGEEQMMFACDSELQRDQWMIQISQAKERCMQTMHLGAQLAKDARAFRCVVTNRRLKVGSDEAPIYKGVLWKVKTDGDRMKVEDWFEREMWLSATGNLVYFSKKEQKELVHYTAEDIADATFTIIEDSDSIRPHTFQVQLRATDDIEFAPSQFAAESDDLRARWMKEMARFHSCSNGEKLIASSDQKGGYVQQSPV